jgi:hypothetical protein
MDAFGALPETPRSRHLLAVDVVFELEVVAIVASPRSTCRPGRSAANDLVDVRRQLALSCDRDGVALLKASRIYERDPVATIDLDMAGEKRWVNRMLRFIVVRKSPRLATKAPLMAASERSASW